MEETVTEMALKVDLQCYKCCRKVKKVLCKFPQIQDQIYYEKQNKVIIKVVSCNPEKIRDKLCYKGDGAIKGIEIREPENKEPKKPKKVTFDLPPKPSPPKEPAPALATAPAPAPAPVTVAPAFVPMPGYPPGPTGLYCRECYGGNTEGPCYQHGYGHVTYYDGYYGRPVYNSWGGGGYGYGYGYDRVYDRCRCTDYICEENPNAACTIM